MKHIILNVSGIIISFLILCNCTQNTPSVENDEISGTTIYHYAVEINGTLCGYTDISATSNGKTGNTLQYNGSSKVIYSVFR